MKTEEAKAKITEMLREKTTVSPQEISYETKGKIPFVQIYSILSIMVKSGEVKLKESDGKKNYTLIDAKDIVPQFEKEKKPVAAEISVPSEDNDEGKSTKVKNNQGGRDLTKYKFNGKEYNKGRLAHAIVAQAAKDKRLSLKGALELFPDEIIPPYGLIKPISEAKKMSKERQRFFIKPEEEVKLRDAVIAVSNQFTKDRIESLISIAKVQLGYSIK
ncbi:MAG: hypothetical protein WBM13_10750 [Bacteroidia bacterium]